ncbi:MAG: class I SAM-dependent methyltransferase [Rhodococcus sp. (in: high G+C Gram-positive bacteria)]|uniref:class I SAM-dependent methyltransferase n=1 Tax=Rhodococcus sp. TaxID=1831 RepID=UPI003BAEE93B
MPSAHHHFHDPRHDPGLVDMIELEAIVSRKYLAEITSWVHSLAAGTPIRRIVDVGAGTGSAGIALATLFADADVVATDISEDMLRRVRERAEETGVQTRVSTAQMDMSKPWSIPGSFDLAWASSCLHEIHDPDRAFRNLFDGLNPGGLLVVVEMDTAPRFLTDEVGDGLESLIRQALQSKRAGHPDHPDWTSNLAQTGFDLVERRQFIVDERPDGGGAGGRYAQAYLERVGPVVRPTLSPADRDVLDALLAETGPSSLRRRDDLHIRGTRTAWAVRRP